MSKECARHPIWILEKTTTDRECIEFRRYKSIRSDADASKSVTWFVPAAHRSVWWFIRRSPLNLDMCSVAKFHSSAVHPRAPLTCKIIKKNGQNLVERKPWPLLVSSRQRNILYFYCYDHYYCFRCKCIERPRFRFFFLSAFDISFKLKLTADLMKSTRPTINANQWKLIKN